MYVRPIGRYNKATHYQVAVGTASTAVIGENLNRKYLLLQNDSDTVVYLAFGTTAAVGKGVRLDANGGRYEMSDALGNLYLGAINAIHGLNDTKNVLVTEGV